MTSPAIKTLSFSVLVEKCDEAFVGYCLETGLVATSVAKEDVLSKMGKLLVRQITFALDNGRLQDIYHSAPKEIWDKWIKTEELIIGTSCTAIPVKEGAGSYPRFAIDQTAYAATC